MLTQWRYYTRLVLRVFFAAVGNLPNRAADQANIVLYDETIEALNRRSEALDLNAPGPSA